MCAKCNYAQRWHNTFLTFIFILWKFYTCVHCILIISPPTISLELHLWLTNLSPHITFPSFVLLWLLLFSWVQLVMLACRWVWDHPLEHVQLTPLKLDFPPWVAISFVVGEVVFANHSTVHVGMLSGLVLNVQSQLKPCNV